MVDTIIFDLDGTLVDTRSHTVACINYALSQIGESPLDAQIIISAIGLTLANTFQTILPSSSGELINKCVSLYKVYQQDHSEEAFREIGLYPAVKETLQELSGYHCVIATSKPAWLANQILILTGISEYFLAVVGAEDVL